MSNKVATTISELAGKVDASEVSITTTHDNKPIQEILDGIHDSEIDTNDDYHGYIHEMIDGLVDIYNSDLHEWVGKEDHGSYVSQAVEDGIADTSDFERMIQAGQYVWYEAIFAEVFGWLETALEERFDEGVYVEAYYLDENGNTTEEGVSPDIMVDDVLISGEIEEHEISGLFLVVGIDPDDAEYIFDTFTDDEGREFRASVREEA